MKYRMYVKDAAHNVTNVRDFDSQDDAVAWVQEQAGLGAFPENFETTLVDITTEVQEQLDEDESKAARAIGSRVIDRLRGVNIRKGFDAAKLIEIASNPQIQLAKLFLDTGAPAEAKKLIVAQGPTWYTPDEIAYLVKPIG